MDTSFSDLCLYVLEHEKAITEDQYLKIVEVIVTPQNYLSIMRKWFVKGKTQNYFLEYIDKNSEKITFLEFSPEEMCWFFGKSKKKDDDLFLILSDWIRKKRPTLPDVQRLVSARPFTKLSTDVLLKGLLGLGDYAYVCVKALSASFETRNFFFVGAFGKEYEGYKILTDEDISKPEFLEGLNKQIENFGGLFVMESIRDLQRETFELATKESFVEVNGHPSLVSLCNIVSFYEYEQNRSEKYPIVPFDVCKKISLRRANTAIWSHRPVSLYVKI